MLLLLVPRPGVEPGWMLLHWCLRPARLPIPPSGQLFFLIAVQRYGDLFNLPNFRSLFSSIYTKRNKKPDYAVL